jgi:hypothetical protein
MYGRRSRVQRIVCSQLIQRRVCASSSTGRSTRLLRTQHQLVLEVAMSEFAHVETVVVALGDPSDEAWEQKLRDAERESKRRVSSFRSGIISDIDVSVRDIGRGADWTVLVLSFVIAAWATPEIHRKVRENIEEWCRIYQELHRFFTWIARGKRVLYPDQYLFLKAIQNLPASPSADLEFKGLTRLPESSPDLQGREDLLFSFGDGRKVVQVAVSRSGDVIWQNTIEV